jgi:hypothetical protein
MILAAAVASQDNWPAAFEFSALFVCAAAVAIVYLWRR